MPTPTIPAGNLFMNATTYTGNGATQSIANGGTGTSFQPDMVWVKNRNSTNTHNLTDSVRGVSKILNSATTAAELNDPTYFVTDLLSNGFTQAGNPAVGSSGNTYVGWQWKAGGTAVTNTSGATSSQVSANTTSGFSVVTYTSPNTTSDTTIGHGLGVTPQFIIAKNRDASFNWDIWHKDLSSGYGLIFATDAETAGRWSTTTPTSSVFTAKYNFEHVSTNKYVAYCFAPIAGYSAFGKYTGNGSADGPFVYTGFRPRFVMWKRTDSTGDWGMEDSSRDSYNTPFHGLYANLSSAEDTAYNLTDLLSNGFKFRGATVGNASGGTYIYAAFAENPFKYALAR